MHRLIVFKLHQTTSNVLLEKEVNSLIVEIIKEHEKINAGKGIEHSIVTLNVLKNAIYKASKMPNNENTSFKVWKIRTIIDEYIEFLTNKDKNNERYR